MLPRLWFHLCLWLTSAIVLLISANNCLTTEEDDIAGSVVESMPEEDMNEELSYEKESGRSTSRRQKLMNSANNLASAMHRRTNALGRRLMNFRDFKRRFHKVYSSTSEETLRHAVYCERLLQVSKSVFEYKNYVSNTYKSINANSDMTPQEREMRAAKRPERIMTQEIESKYIIGRPGKLALLRGKRATNSDSSGWFSKIFKSNKNNNTKSNNNINANNNNSNGKHTSPEPKASKNKSTEDNEGDSKSKPSASVEPKSVKITKNSSREGGSFRVTDNLLYNDLRSTECFFPSGDQGKCNSCASFVAIAQLEYLYCRERGELVKFSEQFPIDCGQSYGMMGCGGSDVRSLNQFISQVGLMSGTSYPYVGHKLRCPYYNKQTQRYNFLKTGATKLKQSGILGVDQNKWASFLEQKIPLHVGVLINDDFDDYGGGVASSCQGGRGAHGMLLVGDGRENGVDYWLLRNSYGEWGIEGHFKLSKKATGCISDNGLGYLPSAFLKTFGSSFI